MADTFDLKRPLDLRLPGGGRFLLRRVRPDDKERIRDGLEHFSVQSTTQRFFTPKIRLTDQRLRYLTEVDGKDHAALGLIDRADAAQPGAGIGRYIRLEEEPAVAEAAISVIDPYQGRGLGTVLLAALSRVAVGNGVEAFRAYLLDENKAFTRFLVGLGATHRRSSTGLVELNVPVHAGPDAVPDTPAGASYRRAFEVIAAAAVHEESDA